MMASAVFCRASPVRQSDAGAAKRRASPPTIAPPSSQRPASRGAPGAGWRVRRPPPSEAPWTGRLSVCCSRVGCAGRKRRRCAAVQDATDGRGVLVYVRRSKTDQDGTAADVRYLKNGCAAAVRQLRDRLTVRRSGLRPDATETVLGGLNGQSIARRLTAAARAAGIDGRVTGHSGRIGLASELTARGASTTETMLAGGCAAVHAFIVRTLERRAHSNIRGQHEHRATTTQQHSRAARQGTDRRPQRAAATSAPTSRRTWRGSSASSRRRKIPARKRSSSRLSRCCFSPGGQGSRQRHARA